MALVTGAEGGTGRAIAIKPAECGAAVTLIDLEAVESGELAGPFAIPFAADV